MLRNFLSEYWWVPMYLVNSASEVRGHGLLGVTRMCDGPSDVGTLLLCVEDDPSVCVEITGGRIVFDELNNVTDRSILIIKVPLFPISDLVGLRLVPHFTQ